MSWYRHYRPTTISGLHLQSVREQLEKLRASKVFPHALLLTGPRGAGKTSTARILAAMLNDPANAGRAPLKDADQQNELIQRIIQGSSLAVHEMDAASHRGIDDVRALKEQAYLPPQEGSTLVFILDEVHMLTTEAFNALLKLLEEPPSHVVFILATTEEHKVPATIISRSTIVRFHKATPDELKAALTPIIKDQQLNVDSEALDAVVASADGSFRDAVKTLETVSAGIDHVTLDSVQSQLRSTPSETIAELIQSIISKDDLKVVGVFRKLREANADQKQFLSAFLQHLHQQLVLSVTSPDQALYAKRISQYLLSQFSVPEVAYIGPISFLNLELRALEIVFKAQERNSGEAPKPAPTPPSTPTPRRPVPQDSSMSAATPVSHSLSDQVVTTVDAVADERTEVPAYFSSDSSPKSGDPALAMMLIEKWMEFIATVEKHNSSLAALLRSAKASLSPGGQVCVEVFYQFHRDQLRLPKFQHILDQSCVSLIGQSALFEFQLAKSSKVTESLSSVSVPGGESEQLVKLAQEVFL
jgi:DNA polymerase-3 subunit gamma/tau